MSETFISVCIPARNGAERLPATLSNLLQYGRYSKDRFEVLVGDHGSSDETAALVRGAQELHGNVRLVPVEYRGPNRAFVRNRLIEGARGELLIFIDHDVLAGPYFLAAHAAAHRAHPRSLVIGYTFGKGVFRQEVADQVARLRLNEIGASEGLLRSEPALHDFRVSPSMLGPGAALRDITDEPAAYRFAWTCNVSATRSDIDRCGGFDEHYQGWGIEDDDFARQLYAGGCRLLFSEDAWGLHVPHAVDMLPNMASWRRNYEHYFAKFPTRELELYAMFGFELSMGQQRVQRLLGMLSGVSDALPGIAAPASGRSATLLCGAVTARQLGVSDVFDPTLPPRELPVAVEGTTRWSLLGIKTPLEDGSLECLIIPADRLMLVDPLLQLPLLNEAARIAKDVWIVSGSRCREPAFAFLLHQLEARMARLGLSLRSAP